MTKGKGVCKKKKVKTEKKKRRRKEKKRKNNGRIEGEKNKGGKSILKREK